MVEVYPCFFFFQAEDGIRDYKVTGVQTCALPISLAAAASATVDARGGRGPREGENMPDHLCTTHRGCVTRGNSLATCLVMLVLVLISGTNGSAADKRASNKHPLSFGQGQTIIDLQNVVWE